MTVTTTTIGVDESGKGDFFGPLVIGAVAVRPEDAVLLDRLQVRDSKRISDGVIAKLAVHLHTQCTSELVVIGPESYNRLYAKMKNLNRLLAWGHARAIENVLARCPAELAISDKFGKPELIERALLEKGKGIELQQIVRGEAELPVAAASIIARAKFVEQMDRLSARFGVKLPKGAAPQVDRAGVEVVTKHGPEALALVAKVHFKNYGRVMSRAVSN